MGLKEDRVQNQQRISKVQATDDKWELVRYRKRNMKIACLPRVKASLKLMSSG